MITNIFNISLRFNIGNYLEKQTNLMHGRIISGPSQTAKERQNKKEEKNVKQKGHDTT